MGEILTSFLNLGQFSVRIKQHFQTWIFNMALKAYKAVYIFSPLLFIVSRRENKSSLNCLLSFNERQTCL